ncbi:helix-turn-helix domain-containing protein [Clostridium sp. DL1XJH146]
MVLNKKELGEKIKEARKIKANSLGIKNYTQKKLADNIGLSQSYIGDIEAGSKYPNYTTLAKIADTCDVPISFFYSEEELNKKIENYLKSVTNWENKEELKKAVEEIKGDPEADLDYIYESRASYCINGVESPIEATELYLMNTKLIEYCGYELENLSEEDFNEFAKEILGFTKYFSERYKK